MWRLLVHVSARGVQVVHDDDISSLNFLCSFLWGINECQFIHNHMYDVITEVLERSCAFPNECSNVVISHSFMTWFLGHLLAYTACTRVYIRVSTVFLCVHD